MAQTSIYLASQQTMRLSGIGEVTWGINLSDVRSKIDNELPDNAEIEKITLYFYGSSYNNNILKAYNEYVHCALTNSDSEAASNNDGGSGNCTNLIKYGPYEISGKSTTTIPDQTADITKYFGAVTPHNVQNTNYSRLTVAFTSKAVYNKDETFSVLLLINYSEKVKAIFVNWDRTILKTEIVNSGSKPSAPSNPTRAQDIQYTYTFSGWDPAVDNITSDTTYTAQFTATKRKYTINFVNYDNSPLETKEVEYGIIPTYTGATPKKPSDAQYDYVFSTWNPSVIAVTGAATYKAVFNSVLRHYTVSVTDGVINLESGNLVDGKYSYGSVLKIIANEKVGYKFINWSGDSTSTEKEISYTVTGNASFVANYRTLQMKFKSVKILHHSNNEVASPTNPLIGGEDGDQAIIKVEIALE